MAEKKKITGMLGLSAKAGKIICGCEQVCEKIRSGKGVHLVLISGDVSQNTEKRLVNCCTYYGVKYFKLDLTQAEISHAVGKSGNVSSVALVDKNFSDAIKKLL